MKLWYTNREYGLTSTLNLSGNSTFQPLARLGAFVIGLEPVEESIKVAGLHLAEDPQLLSRVKYINGLLLSFCMHSFNSVFSLLLYSIFSWLRLSFFHNL